MLGGIHDRPSDQQCLRLYHKLSRKRIPENSHKEARSLVGYDRAFLWINWLWICILPKRLAILSVLPAQRLLY
jgi:hypothetical protein